ncbi:hypothetical protein ACFL54_02075 [Planctomycetota bacterium]
MRKIVILSLLLTFMFLQLQLLPGFSGNNDDCISRSAVETRAKALEAGKPCIILVNSDSFAL